MYQIYKQSNSVFAFFIEEHDIDAVMRCEQDICQRGAFPVCIEENADEVEDVVFYQHFIDNEKFQRLQELSSNGHRILIRNFKDEEIDMGCCSYKSHMDMMFGIHEMFETKYRQRLMNVLQN